MKIRNGFVSNSSSSSFIMYGVHYKMEDEDTYNKLEKLCQKHNVGFMNVDDGDDYIIGNGFSFSEDDDYDTAPVSKLVGNDEKILAAAAELGIEKPEILIHFGTRCS
jgi:hypothetical protein